MPVDGAWMRLGRSLGTELRFSAPGPSQRTLELPGAICYPQANVIRVGLKAESYTAESAEEFAENAENAQGCKNSQET